MQIQNALLENDVDNFDDLLLQLSYRHFHNQFDNALFALAPVELT